MKLIQVKQLAIPGVKVIQFSRFTDARGYFTETFRRSDANQVAELSFIKDVDFVQLNESYSKAGVIKGLHFQWQPPLGKLLRVVSGHMVDMILDIRKNSPTEGKIILYNMPSSVEGDCSEWLWLPPGIAHGGFFLENSIVEYCFSVEYSASGEAGISPLASDFDWSLCDQTLRHQFEQFKSKDFLINNNDKNGLSVSEWLKDKRSENFFYVPS